MKVQKQTRAKKGLAKKPAVKSKQPAFVPLPFTQTYTASDVGRMLGLSELSARKLIKKSPNHMIISSGVNKFTRISRLDLIELLHKEQIPINRRLWRKRLNIGWVNWMGDKTVSAMGDWTLRTIVDAGFELCTGNIDGLIVWASSIAGDDLAALARIAEQMFIRTLIVIPHGYNDGEFLETPWFRVVNEDEWHSQPEELSGWVRFEV